MKPASRRRAPTTVKRTVGRGRLPNTYYRTREYLTVKEVERLIKAAGRNRYGHRDATMILLAFRHGLRASELCSLRWERSISPLPGCTSRGSKVAYPRSIRSPAVNCARYGAFSASRIQAGTYS